MLTLQGNGFLQTATLTLDGQSAPCTFVDTATLTTTVPASLLVNAHTLQVIVTTPSPGGGSSAPLGVPVNNVSPDLVSITPTSAFVGAAATTVTFSGTSFLSTSVARFDGTALSTTYSSASSLTRGHPRLVPHQRRLAPARRRQRRCRGTSAPVTFTVGCDTTGVDAVLAFASTQTTLNVTWATQSSIESIAKTGHGVCPSSEGDTGEQPYVGWVVQNATSTPRTLEAWAVCTQFDDAFLTVYNRTTVPTTLTQALQCTGVISEGLSGYGGYGAPEPDDGQRGLLPRSHRRERGSHAFPAGVRQGGGVHATVGTELDPGADERTRRRAVT